MTGRRLALAVGLFLAGSVMGCETRLDPLGDEITEVKRRFEATCSRCHPLDIPLRRRKSVEGWRKTVQAMRLRGAELTDDQAEEIVRYLAGVRGL